MRWEQAIYKCLLNEQERQLYYAKFNVNGLLRGDFATRMNGYAIARQNGWMSANDIRELEEINPLPDELGGNEYLVNGNMMPITSALQNTGGGNGEQKGDSNPAVGGITSPPQ